MTSKFHFPFLSCVLSFDSQKTSGNGSWLCPWGSTFCRGWWKGIRSNAEKHEHPGQMCEACSHPGIPFGSELSSTTWGRFGAIVLKSNRKKTDKVSFTMNCSPPLSHSWRIEYNMRQNVQAKFKKQSDPGQWGAEGTAKVEKWRVSWFTEHSKFWEWAGPVESIGERSHLRSGASFAGIGNGDAAGKAWKEVWGSKVWKKMKTKFSSLLCCYTLCGVVSKVVLGLQYRFFASISEVLRISECMNWMQE